MKNKFSAKAEAIINVSPEKVWQALTDPAMVKQYLFGTEMTTDWKVGAAITYKGEWEGKAYEDKGLVMEFEPPKRIVSTYWSSFSGLPDAPENYQTVAYELSPQDSGTRLTITQSNVVTQDSADHSKKNWDGVLAGMKKLLETKA